jgi:hypothetical protein
MGLAVDSPIEQDVLQSIVEAAQLRDAKLIVVEGD